MNAKDEFGYTPLHLAVLHGRTDIAQALINAGADIARWTPLHFAATYGRTDIAQALITAGADVNAQGRWIYPAS